MPGGNEYLAQFFVKINGQDVAKDVMGNVIEIVVDMSLHLPDMFTILLNDPTLKWVDDNLFKIGNPVEITAQPGTEVGEFDQAPSSDLLIKGEITAVEPSFRAKEGVTTLLIRGYDKSHRLHRGKKTRTFTNQTDSAIVQRIAGEVGLSPQIDATNITYDYVLQNNQTNMEFLLTRAERIGYQVYAAEDKLYFKKGDAVLGQGPSLVFADNLLGFEPRLTTSHQASKMVVKGWDEKGKTAITAQATPNTSLNQGGMTQTGGATAGVFGEAEEVIVNQPVFTVDEAQALADALGNDINREFIQAEGRCYGDPRVKAGWTVTVTGVGTKFSGKYFVTSATHTYYKDGYETTFTISGRHPNTLSHLLDTGNGHDNHGLMAGVTTGLVTNINDDEGLGRVKVKYTWLGKGSGGQEIESNWVRIATPMGGGSRGFFYLPEVNDEVLLAFAHGDIHHPYIIGTLWNSQDKPPAEINTVVKNGKVNQRVLRSRTGHVIVLDDTQGSEQMVIRDKTGKNELVIDSKTNSMSIKVDGDFSVESKGKVTINGLKGLSLESKSGNSSVKGIQSTFEGTAKTTLKAPTVNVEGTALTQVKGALIKLN